MPNAFHVSLDVPDLDAAVAFYQELLGAPPARQKPGYAKFELADPPLALALQQAARSGLSHLGIRVPGSGEVEAASSRLVEAGLAIADERGVSCCYARQDKVWASDPAGTRWEIYAVLGDADGEDADDAQEAAHVACCGGAESGEGVCCGASEEIGSVACC